MTGLNIIWMILKPFDANKLKTLPLAKGGDGRAKYGCGSRTKFYRRKFLRKAGCELTREKV
jgi:hypothetical protein